MAPRPCVLDVGAGFLDAPAAGEWLARHLVVALLAPAEVAFERVRLGRADERTLGQYRDAEYLPHRLALYGLSPAKSTRTAPPASWVSGLDICWRG